MGAVAIGVNVSVGGVAAMMVIALAFVAAGVVIVLDWRGWGTRSYEFTIRQPLSGFYRDWGFNTYRTLVGGAWVVIGCVFMTVAGVVLLRS